MLSYLIDAEDFVENRLKVDSSYFECTNEFVKKLLSGWSDTEINTAQQKLRERGLIDIIKISTAGCVKHKFIKLNIENICKLKNNSTFKITDSPIIVIKKYST